VIRPITRYDLPEIAMHGDAAELVVHEGDRADIDEAVAMEDAVLNHILGPGGDGNIRAVELRM
jgi:hypothetical protein